MNLCEGEQATGAERRRDISIAVGSTSIAALISILASVGLNNLVGFPLLACCLFGVAAVVSLILGFVFRGQARKAKTTSSYVYVHGVISEFFEKRESTR